MRGVIFSFRNRRARRGLPEVRLPSLYEVQSFFRRRGAAVFFTVVFLGGLFIGSVSASNLKTETLKSLDLLFTTNLPERLKGGFLGAFAAEFASDFLFMLAAVLLSLSIWGGAVLPFAAMFKGFGVGLSAAYLISSYGVKGALFYVLIILPGVFIFSISLVWELCACYNIYKKIIVNLVKGKTYPLKGAIADFFKKSLKYFLWALTASLISALLWVMFAGLFKM